VAGFPDQERFTVHLTLSQSLRKADGLALMRTSHGKSWRSILYAQSSHLELPVW